MIPKTEYSDAFRRQMLGSPLITLFPLGQIVLATIELYSEVQFLAIEIENVLTDGMLPPEFQSIKSLVP
jgi:hypothetical protein